MKNKIKILIILLFFFFAYQLGQEQANQVFDIRLQTCITSDYQFIPSDYCLYGRNGYQLNYE